MYRKDYLLHVGVGPDDNPPGRGSGRYEKGSGERPYQHDPRMLNRHQKKQLKKIDKNYKENRQLLEGLAKRDARYRFENSKTAIMTPDMDVMSGDEFMDRASKLARKFIDDCYDEELNQLYADAKYNTSKKPLSGGIIGAAAEMNRGADPGNYDDISRSVLNRFNKNEQYMINRYYASMWKKHL